MEDHILPIPKDTNQKIIILEVVTNDNTIKTYNNVYGDSYRGKLKKGDRVWIYEESYDNVREGVHSLHPMANELGYNFSLDDFKFIKKLPALNERYTLKPSSTYYKIQGFDLNDGSKLYGELNTDKFPRTVKTANVYLKWNNGNKNVYPIEDLFIESKNRKEFLSELDKNNKDTKFKIGDLVSKKSKYNPKGNYIGGEIVNIKPGELYPYKVKWPGNGSLYSYIEDTLEIYKPDKEIIPISFVEGEIVMERSTNKYYFVVSAKGDSIRLIDEDDNEFNRNKNDFVKVENQIKSNIKFHPGEDIYFKYGDDINLYSGEINFVHMWYKHSIIYNITDDEGLVYLINQEDIYPEDQVRLGADGLFYNKKMLGYRKEEKQEPVVEDKLPSEPQIITLSKNKKRRSLTATEKTINL